MSDVFTDLATETEALAAFAERHGYGAAPDITAHFARLTSAARLIQLSVENPGAFGVTAQISFATLDEAILCWLIEQRKANSALAGAPPEEGFPWRDGPLRPSALGAAALTELFTGGQDIADTFDVHIGRDDSIGHVAYFGVRTRDRVYRRHGLNPPAEQFRFELTAPSGTVWEFGAADAPERVAGGAEDFCLAFTGRRPARGSSLKSHGPLAGEWLELLED